MIQNAILYVLRKKKRTCILFIILTTVLSFLYSSLNIMKLSNNLENDLYKISNTSISITQKDNQNFEINQFKEMENIQEIKEIIPQYDCLAKATNVEVVDGIQKVERENLLELGLNENQINRNVLKLSGGQQQRVAIARALVSEAPVILADEPTGNLDNDTAGEIIEILKKLAKERNKCVIVVTHSREVANSADIILELSGKKLKKISQIN